MVGKILPNYATHLLKKTGLNINKIDSWKMERKKELEEFCRNVGYGKMG
jgi:hypothetical protein